MIESFIIASVLILFRCAAFIAFLPPMAGRGMPNTVKIGLAMAFTVVLAPLYAGTAALQLELLTGPAAWLQIGYLIAREVALGAGLAWLFGLCLVPARIAGSWIAQEMGLTLGQLTTAGGQPSNVVSAGFETLAMLLFFGLNIHHFMFFALGQSFVTRPLLQSWSMPSWESVVYAVSAMQQAGLMIVAPVGILLFVTSITLLVTMRTSPQFNFMSYGMTMRLLAGIVGMVLFLPEVIMSMQYFMLRSGVDFAS